ncbi:MAG: hypothetical protein L0387_27030 [Acidobacteria bacterium]|nr:hypothetical protein [Acidobacteriota bacterium]MCI0625255.1 hypothetical protein [Acidobacteriota bacterium]
MPSRTKRILSFGTLTITTAVAGFLSSRVTQSQVFQWSQTPRTPFTVIKAEKNFSKDGIELRMHDKILTEAFKSNGSRVVVVSSGHPPFFERNVSDVHTKTLTHYFPDIRSKSTFPMSDFQVQRMLERPANCGPQEAEQAEFMGYQVRIEKVQLPQSEIAMERWLALQLDCFPIKEVYSMSGRIRTTREATSIILGEPDPLLFDVPSWNWVERAPSQVTSELKKQYPHKVRSDCSSCDLDIDETYNGAQSRRQ